MQDTATALSAATSSILNMYAQAFQSICSAVYRRLFHVGVPTIPPFLGLLKILANKEIRKAHRSDTWVIFVGYFLFIGIVSRDESVERVQGYSVNPIV
jgi:hypothetical protein